MSHTTLALLLQSNNKTDQNLSVVIKVDGQQQKIKTQELPGRWGWYKVPITAGSHKVGISLSKTDKLKSWSGTASVYLIGDQQVETQTIMVQGTVNQPSSPPVVQPEETLKRQKKLGEFNVSF